MATRWIDHILGPDTEAAKPDPTTVPDGALYQNSDTGVLEINRAGTWADYRSAVDAGALSDLSDVDTTGVADGDALTFDLASGLWVPGAGGSGGTNKDPRWTVLSGQTSIDEFNDASLDVAWVRVDGTGAASGNLTWTENGDVLSAYNIGGDSSDKFHALLRPLTGAGGSMSAGDAFVSCLRFFAPHSSPSIITVVGLVLSDGVTFGSGNQVFAEVGDINAAINLQAFSWTGFGTSGTSAGALSVSFPLPVPIYVRLVMTATNTWRADYSIDGVSWIKGKATLSKTMTPTHVGFVDSSYATALDHIASWEFLRRVSGVS